MTSRQYVCFIAFVFTLNALGSTAPAQLLIDGGGLLLVEEGPAVSLGGDCPYHSER